jgi:hypothetical protein
MSPTWLVGGKRAPRPGAIFPAVRHHLERPPLAMIRPYPRRRKATSHIQVPSVDMIVFEEYRALETNIGLAERGILTLVYICFLDALRTEASRLLQIYSITRITYAGFHLA